MPGQRITRQQEQLYMTLRKTGHSQSVASAKSGMSERTGRTLEKRAEGSGTGDKRRHWRTRKDPLALGLEQRGHSPVMRRTGATTHHIARASSI